MKKRHLFLFLILGLVVVNSCQREYSLESGNGPSEGTLQDDVTGNCLPKTVNGAYVVGVALVGTVNYIEVQVDVTTVGNFTIYTDTVNGMYFRASGVFTTTGLNTVRLKGFGTPAAIGITNFVVNYGTSACTIAVTTSGSLAIFTLDGAPGGCMGATPAGTYTAGTILNASNTVTIHVTVTTAGAYNIATVVSNGMTFSGFGTLAVGAQTIVLTGAGTPTTSGSTNVPVSVGSSSCGFTLSVGGTAPTATYTINCPSAVPNGTYTQNTALTATNTVTITVDVATAGTYSITGTVNGMTFTSPVGASFAAAGPGQTVTLNGTGTPTVSGANTVPLTGGTAGCSFTVNVTPAAGAAVFVANCATATVNGTYTQNTALIATNTITLPVNVTTIGTYNITTTLANGMTFTSGAGTFAATGVQNVTLNGSGTPTASGATIIPVPAGTTPCNITINVTPAAGAAVFVVNCATATVNGTYTQNTALIASNTITLPVNVTTIGTYNITTTLANGLTFTSGAGTFAATGVQNVTLNGSGTPTVSGATIVPVPAGTTPCNITITVNPAAGGPAVFVVNCATAIVNGTYTQNVVLTAANKITLPVNVTTIGTYNITTTLANGMTFTSGAGTFAATGVQNVTLNGSGTPTASGATIIPVPAGTTPCNITITVNPPAGGPAVFAVNCATATVNGTYLINTVLVPATNTITLPVNVTTAGTYTITTTATNGMTFTASGTFAATGVQNVTLNGSGTPTASGDFTLPVPSGTTPCSIDITVYMGTWSFTEGANNYSGFIDDAALDPTLIPPYNLLYIDGPTAAGHYFEIDMADISGAIQNNEIYNAFATFPGATNAGAFIFDDPLGNNLYTADPATLPNSFVITVTSHNTATKKVIGTFSGTAQDAVGNPKVITNGVFSVTYP